MLGIHANKIANIAHSFPKELWPDEIFKMEMKLN